MSSSDDYDALAMPTSDVRHRNWTSSPFWKYRVRPHQLLETSDLFWGNNYS